jgi:uncharacterized membrane protein
MKFRNSTIERYLHDLFEIGVFFKAINGIWETLTGWLVFYFGITIRHHHMGARNFAAAYVLIHGIVNLFLAIQLLRQRLWAYLVAIGIMATFVIYQLYRIHHYHSRVLIFFTVVDILFIFLTWHEYRHRKQIKKAMDEYSLKG